MCVLSDAYVDISLKWQAKRPRFSILRASEAAQTRAYPT